MKKYSIIGVVFLLLFSCTEEKEHLNHFPEIHYPEDNLPSAERIELGEKMFFSTLFSIDSSKSCASCHMPKYAFADTVSFSLGVKNRIGTRNSPSLLNVAYRQHLLRDGVLPTLEKQVTVPIHEHLEFDFNIVLLAERMNQDSIWVKMAQEAYNRKPDPFVITRALAAFQRTLISNTSSYDYYVNGNTAALSSIQQKGLELFNGKAKCGQCHSGLFFTNETLKNNGLHTKYIDSGRMRLSLAEEDRAMFSVPSLRNVAITGPYMHDGSLHTLEDVVEHYNSGGKKHPNKSQLIDALNLSSEEKEALISFLKSLSDKKTIEFYDTKYN